MPQNPFDLDKAIDELRSITPGGSEFSVAAHEMQRKVSASLRASASRRTSMKLVRISAATAIVIAAAGAAIMLPRTSYASGIRKVAKAFQAAENYHIKSFWTTDGKRSLNAESWFNGDQIKTQMYGADGKPLDLGPIEITHPSKPGTHAKGETKTMVDKVTLEVTSDKQGGKQLDGKSLQHLLNSVDKSDPRYEAKMKAIITKETGGTVSFKMEHHSDKGAPRVMADTPGSFRTQVSTSSRVGNGPVITGSHASIQYSAVALRILLQKSEMWQPEPTTKLNGQLVDHYRSKTSGMELFVNPTNSLPVRVVSHVTVNGKSVETDDYYDYSNEARP